MTQSEFINLRTTSYGGRSFFATQFIPQGTHIHTSDAPFAHVIYKDYRREVCAQCFAYAASSKAKASSNNILCHRRTWSIKSCRQGAESVWFCTDQCKIVWQSGNIDPLLADLKAVLTKAQTATRKNHKIPLHNSPCIFQCELDVQITQDYIDNAWAQANNLVEYPHRLSSYCSTMNLQDMELEIARSVASSIVHRYVFDHHSIITTSDPWTAVLDLQNSELSNVRLRPYILLAHLRVYAFLSYSLPKHLRVYVHTIRNLLARTTANAFGIWDEDPSDEMFGWGVWVTASYFNHSCCPNVKKTRIGRTMHFTTSRSVETGEELCISYIDINQSITQRRRELEDNWFFGCRCQRCQSEEVVG